MSIRSSQDLMQFNVFFCLVVFHISIARATDNIIAQICIGCKSSTFQLTAMRLFEVDHAIDDEISSIPSPNRPFGSYTSQSNLHCYTLSGTQEGDGWFNNYYELAVEMSFYCGDEKYSNIQIDLGDHCRVGMTCNASATWYAPNFELIEDSFV